MQIETKIIFLDIDGVLNVYPQGRDEFGSIFHDVSSGSIERGYEIQRYIDLFDVKTYCIIDDDADMLESQMNNFVQTSENQDHPDCVDIGYGLTKICAEKVVTILNR